jgi:ABC-type uncharacterized transport system permease subunit
VLSLIPLLLYLAAAVLLVRATRSSPGVRQPLVVALATVGLVVHAVILFRAIETPHGLEIAITDTASLVGFVVGASTVIGLAFMDLAALPAALLLLAGVLASGTGVLTGFREIHAPQWEITAHITLAALAAGWLAIASIVVLLLSWQDTRLRTRTPMGVLGLLPPVETLEITLFRALTGGFIVLTFVLLTGLFFVTDVIAQHLVHKMVLAIVAWLVFATLLWGRYRYGWRGRKARKFTTVGFVILALAYFGSKFVLENVLGRHWG